MVGLAWWDILLETLFEYINNPLPLKASTVFFHRCVQNTHQAIICVTTLKQHS